MNINSVNIKFGITAVTDKLIAQDSDSTANRVIYAHPDYEVKTVIFSSSDASLGIINSTARTDKYNGKKYSKLFRKTILWDFGDGYKVETVNASHVYSSPGKYKITATFFDIDRKAYLDSFYIYVIVKEVIPTIITSRGGEKTSIKCSEITNICNLNSFISKNYNRTFGVIPNRLDESRFQEKHYEDIKDRHCDFPHLEKYYTFIQKEKVYKNNFRTVYEEIHQPTTEYMPDYYKIYTRFYDNGGGKIGFEGYFVSSEEDSFKIRIVDPNISIEGEPTNSKFKEYTFNNRPEEEGMSFSGYWGKVDVYYKNDYVSTSNNSISFVHDIVFEALDENLSLTSSQYFNVEPFGFNFSVSKNVKTKVFYYLSVDGFIRDEIPDGEKVVISSELYNSLTKDYDLPCFLVPYIKGQEGFYIAKDISSVSIQAYSVQENDSMIFVENDTEELYYKRLLLRLKSNLSANLKIGTTNYLLEKQNITKSFLIPKEKIVSEDFERLMSAYMPHKMFENAFEIKSFLRNVLTNGDTFNYILTRSKNFLNDNLFHKQCYILNLVSILKSMGEDVSEFETSDFSAINEIKDITRIASMNHNELVGHLIDKPLEIYYHSDIDKGKNVGERIISSDVLSFEDGYIRSFSKNDKTVNLKEECFTDSIILRDDYTTELKVVSLYPLLKKSKGNMKISSYDEYWGWGLSLPEEFYDGKTEEERGFIIDRYYSFFLLNPKVEKYRLGNFLDEETITEEVKDVESWNSGSGVIFKSLDSIIKEKMMFDNSSTDIDGAVWNRVL